MDYCNDDQELNWPVIGGIIGGSVVLLILLFLCLRKREDGGNLLQSMMAMKAIQSSDPPDEERPPVEKQKRRRRSASSESSLDVAPPPPYNPPPGPPGPPGPSGPAPPMYQDPSILGPEIHQEQPQIDPLLQAGGQPQMPMQSLPLPMPQHVDDQSIPYAPGQPMYEPTQVFYPPETVAPAFDCGPPPQMVYQPQPMPTYAPQYAFSQPPPSFVQGAQSTISVQPHRRRGINRAMTAPSGSGSRSQGSGSQHSSEYSRATKPSAPVRSQSSAAWSASDLKSKNQSNSAYSGSSRRPLLAAASKRSGSNSEASALELRPSDFEGSKWTTQKSAFQGEQSTFSVLKPDEVVELSKSDFSGTKFRPPKSVRSASEASVTTTKSKRVEPSRKNSEAPSAMSGPAQTLPSSETAKSTVSATKSSRSKPGSDAGYSQVIYQDNDATSDVAQTLDGSQVNTEQRPARKYKRKASIKKGLI